MTAKTRWSLLVSTLTFSFDPAQQLYYGIRSGTSGMKLHRQFFQNRPISRLWPLRRNSSNSQSFSGPISTILLAISRIKAVLMQSNTQKFSRWPLSEYVGSPHILISSLCYTFSNYSPIVFVRFAIRLRSNWHHMETLRESGRKLLLPYYYC